MTEHIGIFVAWPYANGPLHVGHIAGAYLPPDIYARYHRMRGNKALMVSGSDSHGTPITVGAAQAGVPPRQFFEQWHETFLDSFKQLGISFDLFTHTDTRNHHQVAQDIFVALLENGYLYRETQQQLYSQTEDRFLPDRDVEGTCPHCGYEEARGDQCDNCGRLLDALELIDPRSKGDGSTPIARETEHYFLDLPAFSERLEQWIEGQEYWRTNVRHWALGMIREGLQGRPITRDLSWGIPVPLEDWGADKVLYVWFEAVIGYLSASVEWAKNQGEPDAWQAWWYDPSARGSYFVGKDNIPFHAVIWPAMLLGTEHLYTDDGSQQLNLPYDVPANEHLTLENQPMSTSRNWAVWLPDYLERYDPDPLRYYLTIAAPEGRDADFSWSEFVRRNNDELVATWGNLVNRVLNFAHSRFGAQVPARGEFSETDKDILNQVEAAFDTVGQLLDEAKFKAALTEALALAHAANRWLDDRAPWLLIKEDREAAATAVYVALSVVDSLKTLLYPFLPFTCQELNMYLGYDDDLKGELTIEAFEEDGVTHEALVYAPAEVSIDRWQPSQLPAGQALRKPEPLFKKLDTSVADEELERLEEQAAPA
ncbi:MAG: Methionine--tRNA ligase [Anaerolineales bacterium]|nr:Methionine--tRNA ligase [Anaerolineales bacterium]